MLILLFFFSFYLFALANLYSNAQGSSLSVKRKYDLFQEAEEIKTEEIKAEEMNKEEKIDEASALNFGFQVITDIIL